MIRAAIYGRIGGDPVARTTRNGKAMVTVSLAVDVARPGEDRDIEWFSVAAFGATAETLARHQKGDVAAVSGSLSRSRFTGRDGQERASWSITAESIASARTVRPGGRHRTGASKSLQAEAHSERAAPARRRSTYLRQHRPTADSDCLDILPNDRVDDLWPVQ
jgi:single-strand DNA-binding protein